VSATGYCLGSVVQLLPVCPFSAIAYYLTIICGVSVQLADALGLLRAQGVMAGLFTTGGFLSLCAPKASLYSASPYVLVPIAVMSTGRLLVGLGVHLFNASPLGWTWRSVYERARFP
jgi:hypothetical protein